ncbi:MAG: hypothetical protein WD939_00925 [Dehalococcoidia bacterium]
MDALGLLGLLALWGAFGLLPWCSALIAARGQGALLALPLAAIAGMAGGALVPALGAKDGLGFALSLLAATLAGGVTTLSVLRYWPQMRTDELR